jgi:hypothetical protein
LEEEEDKEEEEEDEAEEDGAYGSALPIPSVDLVGRGGADR